MNPSKCMYMYSHIYIYVDVHTCMYSHIYIHVYVNLHVYTYTYIHTCTFICTHTKNSLYTLYKATYIYIHTDLSKADVPNSSCINELVNRLAGTINSNKFDINSNK